MTGTKITVHHIKSNKNIKGSKERWGPTPTLGFCFSIVVHLVKVPITRVSTVFTNFKTSTKYKNCMQ